MKKKSSAFKSQLKKYLSIKGLDIVLYLQDGRTIELNKNRTIVKDSLVIVDANNREMRIPLSTIKSVDLYAA